MEKEEAAKPKPQPSERQGDAHRMRNQPKEESTSPFTGNKSRSIFAWRLPKDTNKEDVHSFFSAAGQVKTIKIVPDGNKMAAYVEFNQEESVSKAVALKGKQLRGSPVAIKPVKESSHHAVPGTSERRSRSIRASRTNPPRQIPSKRLRSHSPSRRETYRRHRSDSDSYSYTSRSDKSLSRSPVRNRRGERRTRRNRSYDSGDNSYDSWYSSRSPSRNRRRHQRSRSRGSSSDRFLRRERRYSRRDYRRDERSRSPRGRYTHDRDDRETRYIHNRRSRRDDRYPDERDWRGERDWRDEHDWRDERGRYSRYDEQSDDYRRGDRYRRGPEDYRRGRDSSSYYNEESPPPKRRRRAPRADRGRDKPAPVEKPASTDLRDEHASTILAWQLPLDSTEEELRAFFSASGDVKLVKLVPDKISEERDKLAAYVEFGSRNSAVRAVSRKDLLLGGHPIRVKLMTGLPNEKAIDKGQMDNHDNADGRRSAEQPKDRNGIAGKSSGRRSAGDADDDSSRKRSHYGTRMISIEELKKLLNPYGLQPPVQKAEGSPGGRLLEPAKKVPLPTPSTGAQDASLRNGHDAFTRLYVGSIPFELSENDLRAIFEPFGQMESLSLQRDASGKSLGYGFVHFMKHESAKNALKANGMPVMGRNLKIGLTGQGHSPGARKSNKAAAVPLPNAGEAHIVRKDLNGELDDGNDGGLAMNASQRAMLMQQLSRGKAMGGNLAVTLKEVSNSTKSLMLGNMFNPKLEPAGFEVDLADDVREECENRYGQVEHIFVEKDSQGVVFVRFSSLEGSSNAMKGLQGRWFGGLQIRASYVADEEYEKRFPELKGK